MCQKGLYKFVIWKCVNALNGDLLKKIVLHRYINYLYDNSNRNKMKKPKLKIAIYKI